MAERQPPPASAPPALRAAHHAPRPPERIIVDVVENHSVPTVAIRGLAFAGDIAAPPAGAPFRRSREDARARHHVAHERADRQAARRRRRHALLQRRAHRSDAELQRHGARSSAAPRRPRGRAEEPRFTPRSWEAKKELENDYLRNDDSTQQRAFARLNSSSTAEASLLRARPARSWRAPTRHRGRVRAFHRAR